MSSIATAAGAEKAPVSVLLSIEPWDQVWRRNQQLASRVPATLFVEPARPGLTWRVRREDGVLILTPPKPVPFRFPGARRLHAVVTAALIRRILGTRPGVTWATHAYHAPLARALDCPLLYDRTDDWPAMETAATDRRVVQVLDRELVDNAHTVVIVSEAMRSQTRPDAVLLPNGVDLEAFAASTPPHRAPGSMVIGFAGTLDPFRIDYEILRSLAAYPGVELLLVGPGTPPDGMTSTGPVPHSAVPGLLARCDALVAPYRVDNPANATSDALKLYEYFATGLPVLATMTAGFERYPDLVVSLPTSSPATAVDAHRIHGPRRREVAVAAGWGARAETMRGLLAGASGRQDSAIRDR